MLLGLVLLSLLLLLLIDTLAHPIGLLSLKFGFERTADADARWRPRVAFKGLRRVSPAIRRSDTRSAAFLECRF